MSADFCPSCGGGLLLVGSIEAVITGDLWLQFNCSKCGFVTSFPTTDQQSAIVAANAMRLAYLVVNTTIERDRARACLRDVYSWCHSSDAPVIEAALADEPWVEP